MERGNFCPSHGQIRISMAERQGSRARNRNLAGRYGEFWALKRAAARLPHPSLRRNQCGTVPCPGQRGHSQQAVAAASRLESLLRLKRQRCQFELELRVLALGNARGSSWLSPQGQSSGCRDESARQADFQIASPPFYLLPPHHQDCPTCK